MLQFLVKIVLLIVLKIVLFKDPMGGGKKKRFIFLIILYRIKTLSDSFKVGKEEIVSPILYLNV